MRNELPDTCFATLPGTGDLIILKRGETGYYRSDWNTSDVDENRSIAEIHNQRRGITPAQVEAMKVGSMFGFHVSGADPQVYYDKAKYSRSITIDLNGTIKIPETQESVPVKGELQQFSILGKECFYLDMAALPETLLGKDSGLILMPDMVQGKLSMPVTVEWGESGLCTMSLENGSFLHESEVNADYQIIAKARVGPVEYAMGEIAAKIPFFVTWERTPAHDQNGERNYYWGHYFDSREQAIGDFCDRASEKFRELSAYRKPSIREQLSAKPVPGDKPKTKPKDKEAR